jgi:hypothetical protein
MLRRQRSAGQFIHVTGSLDTRSCEFPCEIDAGCCGRTVAEYPSRQDPAYQDMVWRAIPHFVWRDEPLGPSTSGVVRGDAVFHYRVRTHDRWGLAALGKAVDVLMFMLVLHRGYWLLRSLKDPVMVSLNGVEYIPQVGCTRATHKSLMTMSCDLPLLCPPPCHG